MFIELPRLEGCLINGPEGIGNSFRLIGCIFLACASVLVGHVIRATLMPFGFVCRWPSNQSAVMP